MYGNIDGGEALLNNQKRKTPIVFDIVLLGFVLLFSGLVLFYYFLAFSPIKGTSMLNTIEWGQCVLLQRRMYTLEHGDIITLDITDENSEEPHILIKRVIGLEDDKILFVRTKMNTNVDMYICKNGETKFSLAEEPYIYEKMKWSANPDSTLYEKVTVSKYVAEERILAIDISETYADHTQEQSLQKQLIETSFTVPKGEVFFLGDNRNNSNDSRHYGSQPTSKIIGKVIDVFDQGSAAEKFFRFMFNNYEKT